MRALLTLLSLLATLVPLHSTASTTTPPPTMDAQLVQSVEKNLLSLFGFRRRPEADRRKAVIPDAMLELYARKTGLELDTASLPLPGRHTQSANTVRTFTHVESPADSRFASDHRFRLSFDLSGVPSMEQLKAAEVQLSRKAVNCSDDDADTGRHLQRVTVHDIVRPGIRGKSQAILRVIDSQVIDVRHADVVHLDVLPAVERWLASPRSNHGVIVQVAHSNPAQQHLRLRRSADEEPADWLHRQPILFTYTDDGKNSPKGIENVINRSRRALAPNRKRKRKEYCRRHPLYVDFSEVGWNDWIVAPPGYEAYYCHGDCPFPLANHLNSTNHAILQTLVNSVNPSAVPKACCVPTSLTSISMLYLDEDSKVVLKNYQDMAVLGCGCR